MEKLVPKLEQVEINLLKILLIGNLLCLYYFNLLMKGKTMNFVGTTTYEGTKKDADELYSMFKDDLAKCTSSFEWAHIREGKMIFIANVTDEEKFYALFEDQRSKDWNAKFNAKDEAWKLEKIM